MPSARRAAAASHDDQAATRAAPDTPPREPPWLRLGAPALILLAGLAAYANSFKGQFVYDDHHAIRTNPYVRSLRTAFDAPPQASLAGRPIAALSFALTYRLFEYNVAGYHAVNLAIHLLAALALFGVVRRTLCSPRLIARYAAAATPIAAAVALLWVVHPLQTQSVTYIIQRTESLVGLFYLFTLYAAIRAMEAGRFGGWTVVAVLACALGMGTKEVMATAPALILLYDLIFFSASPRLAILRRWSLYLGLAASWSILVALMAGAPRSDSVGFGLKDSSPPAYLRSQAAVILHYLRLALWPHPLVLDYGWPLALGWRTYLWPCLVMVGLTLATVRGLLRRGMWAFLPASFLLILSPTSSFVPVNDLCFEQRMYLPLAAVVVAAVLVVHRMLIRLRAGPRRAIATGLALCAVSLMTVRTLARNADYHDALRLWAETVRHRPDNARAQSALGTEYFLREQFDEAVPHYERAVQLRPNHWQFQGDLGRVYHKLQRFDEAVSAYQKAIALSPGEYSVYYNLGVCYFEMERFEEAANCNAIAARLNPAYYQAHFNLGKALLKLKRFGEAEAALTRVLELNPGFERARAELKRARNAE